MKTQPSHYVIVTTGERARETSTVYRHLRFGSNSIEWHRLNFGVCVQGRIVLDAHLNDLFDIISSVVLARKHAIDVYCLRVFLFSFTLLFDFWIFRNFRMCLWQFCYYTLTSMPCHAMPWDANLFLFWPMWRVTKSLKTLFAATNESIHPMWHKTIKIFGEYQQSV